MTAPIEVKIRISMTNPTTALSVGDGIDALLGFTVDDFLTGRVSLHSRIHADDQDIADVLFSADSNKTSDTFNIRLRQANGHIRCVKGIYSKEPDATDNNVILDLLLQDAKSLRQKPGDQPMMTNFKAMMENTDDYIYFKDRNHVFTGASQTLVTVTDPTEHWTDLLGQTDYDLFPEKYADIYYRLEKQVFAGIHVAHEIQKTPDNKGHSGCIDSRKYPIYDDNGEISGLFGIARDISTHINSERYAQFYGRILELLAVNRPLLNILEAIVLGVEQLHPTLLCSILLLDSDGKHLLKGSAPSLPDFYNAAINGLKIGVGVGSCGEAAFTANRVIVDDIASHPNWASYKELAVSAGLGACWSQPILSSSSQVLGTFAIYHHEAHTPTGFDIAIIEQSARLASVAIERKQTDASLARSETKFRTLFNASKDAVLMLNEKGFFDCNNAAMKMFGLQSQEDISLYHPVDLSPPIQPCGRDSMTLAKQYIDVAMKTGSVRFEWMHKRSDTGKNFITEVILSSMMLDGSLFLQTTIHDITARKLAEDIQHLADYDHLTQLANRRLLTDHIQHALSGCTHSSSKGAVMFLDLDYFKTINDTLGHSYGDLLLQQVATRLSACVRKSDTVARLGGDEFVVLLEGLSEQIIEAAAQTKAIGDKMLTALSQPYQLTSHQCHCTASIGVTLFKGRRVSVAELFRQANIAMYQAKDCGRNRLRFFDQQMQDAINSRASIDMDLRNALEQQQFQLYYQIQVDASECPIGAEALIRWLHPERGLVSPYDFIPLAEETGMILPIGQWVLETACAQLKAWERDESTCNLTLSINVSAKQFHQANFVTQVQSAVQRHAINPAKLKLELTESMLADNLEKIIDAMSALNALGIRFSLDDFGTGYSSLQYLKRLPLYQLKIDQSFVRDLTVESNDRALVLTIIAMAQSLGLGVIAEGVETREQQQLLLNKGCPHFQGYLFGRPVPIKQLEVALK